MGREPGERGSEYATAAGPVYIEDAQAIDDLDLISLAVRTRDGQTNQTIVSAADLALAIDQSVTQLSTTQSLANSLDFFLLVEAARIRLAYSFDPFFAVSMSGVQALPHQLQAVYERMLPQARLRFLLADDPGAGKTIMAGLLLKELKLRGVITYVLILTPAPLTIQWQHEPARPTIPAMPPAKPVTPGRGGQRYRLRLQIKPEDFFEVTKALERLNERSASMETIVTVMATAKPGQPFVVNTMHSLVVEPMVEESHAKVLEEQVEEEN